MTAANKKRRRSLLLGAAFILFLSAIMVNGCRPGKNISSNKPVSGKLWIVPLTADKKISMVWIEPGSFIMGSPDSEPGRKPDESPQTEVTLTKGFWLSRTELTIAQWKAVTGESLRDHVIKMLADETVFDFGGQQKRLREFMNFDPTDPERIIANENDSLPMYFVSWFDAMEFCQRLTAQGKAKGNLPGGYEYNLPTEAQWEYACRAGTSTATFAGPLIMEGRTAAVLDNIAWYGGNNTVNYQGKKSGNSGAGPRNSGEKKPNAWGLQDMAGNLWEWCRDWYGPYRGGKVTDPTGAANGMGRVNRGGSCGSGAAAERSASRASNPPPEKSAYRGFRIALTAVQ
jgi:formylglycine-generating enzyme required for sulfatase activity